MITIYIDGQWAGAARTLTAAMNNARTNRKLSRQDMIDLDVAGRIDAYNATGGSVAVILPNC